MRKIKLLKVEQFGDHTDYLFGFDGLPHFLSHYPKDKVWVYNGFVYDINDTVEFEPLVLIVENLNQNAIRKGFYVDISYSPDIDKKYLNRKVNERFSEIIVNALNSIKGGLNKNKHQKIEISGSIYGVYKGHKILLANKKMVLYETLNTIDAAIDKYNKIKSYNAYYCRLENEYQEIIRGGGARKNETQR